MLKFIFIPLQLSLGTFVCLHATPLLAQITSDETVNTQVTQNGNTAAITGGETRGSNLFHSFQDFSVSTGNEAFFNNANEISNIFSRVTGGNISNIDGTIRANGNASLFLINPAGIIFGENARLDIGGSFYGSTASSILFPDGEFSAVDNLNQPTLTINAPIGLGFRDNPGDIVNRSTVRDSADEVIGLEVNPGNNLTFVASNLNFEGGNLTASSGDIYLGAISASGTVEISEDGSFSFAEDISRGDITLSNGSEADVRGSGGGNIKVDVDNLTLEGGELGIGSIRAGINPESTTTEVQPGDITIDATGNILLDEGEITNNVELEGIGNSGNIFVTTDSLSLLNGGLIATITRGQGDAGAVNVTATGDITIDGERDVVIDNGEDSFVLARASGITSRVFPEGVGNSGGVTVFTNNLTLTNGGRVDAGVGGQGNSGVVDVTATGDIIADGEISRGIPSGIASRINPNAIGDAVGVTVSTNNLTLTNGGRVDASTAGQGNAGAIDVTATGDINIDGERQSRPTPSGITSRITGDAVGVPGAVTVSTTNLTLTNGGRIDASTNGQGNAGAVNVTATGDIIADGEGTRLIPSGISSRVDSNAVGDAGAVTVSTTNLTLINGGRVDASTGGQGNAGSVTVTATGDITADGEGSRLSEDPNDIQGANLSGISSRVEEGGEGNSGAVTVSTNNLTLMNGGRVDASTNGRGNAGLVTVNATGDIIADGEGSTGDASRVGSRVTQNAEGNAGGVTVSTNNLTLTNGGRVDASTGGLGNAEAVEVTASGDITIDGVRPLSDRPEGLTRNARVPSGITSRVSPRGEGDAGGVTVSTNNLTLTNGGRVDAGTGGPGNAGEVNVTATGDILIDGERQVENPVPSGITSGVGSRGVGDSGAVTIFTNNLTLTNGGRVDATTRGQGNAGAVIVTATGDIVANGQSSQGGSSGITSTVNENAIGDAGGVRISTNNLNLTNSGQISATTEGQGNANNITIEATESISIDGFIENSRSGIFANALNLDGNGGGVFINTRNLSVTNGGTIEATNFDSLGENPGTGRPGSISITSDNIELVNDARIETATQFTGEESGIINLQVADNIILRDNSFISAEARNEGNGGNLNINSQFTIAFPSDGNGNDLIANAEGGVGGNIQINSTLLGIQPNSADENNGSNDIDASSRINSDGNIIINAPDNNLIRGATKLSTDVIAPDRTIQQVCQANRQSAAINSFNITGKGGIVSDPGNTLDSFNTYVDDSSTSTNSIPAPIKIAQGKIQPARGVEITESGEIILTAYRTNNKGERIFSSSRNCV